MQNQSHYHCLNCVYLITGRYPLELQIVHQKEGSTGDNDLIVASVFFELKRTPGGNKFLSSLDWQSAPRSAGND